MNQQEAKQLTRNGEPVQDCCLNCKNCRYMNVGYMKKEGEDRGGYICEHLGKLEASGVFEIAIEKFSIENGTIDVMICPAHKRNKCSCGQPLNFWTYAFCPDCEADLIRKENESVIVNVITGEVLGKRKDVIGEATRDNMF